MKQQIDDANFAEWFQGFLTRHDVTDQKMAQAAENIRRESVHRRPPERPNIPTKPAHLYNFDAFIGEKSKAKGGNDQIR